MSNSQDHYYEEQIFTKVENHQIPFNWYAALFGPFWFAYKGMWKEWRFLYVPFACALVLLHAASLVYSKYILVTRVLMLAYLFVVAWYGGKVANYNYFVFYKRKSAEAELNQPLRGVTALVGLIVLTGSLFYMTSDYFSLIKLRGAQLIKQSKQDFEINDYKMFPAFIKGDLIKFDLFMDRIFIGDVVLIQRDGVNIVMRVVALENDTIEIIEGRVKINGANLLTEEKKLDLFDDILPSDFVGVEKFKIYQEANENAVYFTYFLREPVDLSQRKIEAGKVFLMTDWRDAGDSTIYDAPLADIIGVYIP